MDTHICHLGMKMEMETETEMDMDTEITASEAVATRGMETEIETETEMETDTEMMASEAVATRTTNRSVCNPKRPPHRTLRTAPSLRGSRNPHRKHAHSLKCRWLTFTRFFSIHTGVIL